MRSKTNHLLRLVANFLLWIAGIFFLLGAISFVAKSLPAAVAMLILSLLLMPFTWRRIRKLNPKALGRLPRFGLVVVAFIAAVALTPTQTPAPAAQKPAVADTAASTKTTAKPSTKPTVTNKTESITDVYARGNSYRVSGTGTANTSYSVKILGDSEQSVKTGNDGKFTVTLAKDAPVFGSIELVKDTNGLWFGGKKTVATAYYSLDRNNTKHSASPLKPVVFGVGGKDTYEVSGYYTPGTTLAIKAGSKELAHATVDKTGRFKLANITLNTNFVSVALYERTSTGWFSSKDTRLTDDQYVDKQARKLLASLPVYTKEVTVSQSVPFTEQTIGSGSLNKGETKVTQEGANGSKDIIYIVTYKGDEETGRQQKSEVVTKQSVAKITSVGTYVAPPAYTAPTSCPNGTYTNSAGNTVCSPYSAPSAPAGATAQCEDGTYSYSQSRRGTCSHHGGVASWL